MSQGKRCSKHSARAAADVKVKAQHRSSEAKKKIQ